MALEVRGRPSQSLPLIHRRGVKQQSSQEMYMLYFLKSSSRSSSWSSPLISTKPVSLLRLYTIFCSVSLRMREADVAGAERYCFSGFGSNLFCLFRDFCHFQPKFVSWSPACTNCSGDSIPFPSKSLSEAVVLESKNFLIPSNITIVYESHQEGHCYIMLYSEWRIDCWKESSVSFR